MVKVLTLFLLLCSCWCEAVEFVWFGTTNIIIRLPESTLMFDPFFTHPNIVSSALLKKMNSDEQLVKRWTDEAKVQRVDSILISHSHYDHILDLGSVMKSFKSSMYGSQSAVNFALGQGAKSKMTFSVQKNQPFILKGIKVLPIEVAHSDHLFGYTFMKGKIETHLKLPASMWEIKDGVNLIYHLSSKNQKILFHPAGNKSPFFNDYKKLSADVLFLGISKRVSTMNQIDKIIKVVNPKVIIPLHFDNFFSDLSKNPGHLPGVNLDEWEKTIKEKLPSIRIIRPKVAQWIKIPE